MMAISISLIAGFMLGLEFQRDDEGEVLVIDLAIVRVMIEWE